MLYQLKDNKMELKIEHIATHPVYMPWDLRTIIELQLSIEDVNTIEARNVLQVGEVYMSLEGKAN